MATHKSAEKRARQSTRRAKRNTNKLSTVRTFEKKVRNAIAANDMSAAKEALHDFSIRIKSAAGKGVLHAKNASRKISRLALRINKMATAATKRA